jgi:hypothetical protein
MQHQMLTRFEISGPEWNESVLALTKILSQGLQVQGHVVFMPIAKDFFAIPVSTL